MKWNLALLLVIAVSLVLIVVFLAIAVVLFLRLYRLNATVWQPGMPTRGKVAFTAALAYALFPVDVLPDPIYLDDIGVLLATLAYLGRLIQQYGLSPEEPTRVPERKL